MRHKQCSRHAVHEVLKSKTCLFTYNAKSNLLSMQAKCPIARRTRYQDRLIRLAVCYRSRFSNTLEMHSIPSKNLPMDCWSSESTRITAEIELNPKSSDECGHSFSSVRFYVLFNSLFRVLFNFPSRYLFAIGLVMIFSFGTSLRPTLA